MKYILPSNRKKIIVKYPDDELDATIVGVFSNKKTMRKSYFYEFYVTIDSLMSIQTKLTNIKFEAKTSPGLVKADSGFSVFNNVINKNTNSPSPYAQDINNTSISSLIRDTRGISISDLSSKLTSNVISQTKIDGSKFIDNSLLGLGKANQSNIRGNRRTVVNKKSIVLQTEENIQKQFLFGESKKPETLQITTTYNDEDSTVIASDTENSGMGEQIPAATTSGQYSVAQSATSYEDASSAISFGNEGFGGTTDSGGFGWSNDSGYNPNTASDLENYGVDIADAYRGGPDEISAWQYLQGFQNTTKDELLESPSSADMKTKEVLSMIRSSVKGMGAILPRQKIAPTLGNKSKRYQTKKIRFIVNEDDISISGYIYGSVKVIGPNNVVLQQIRVKFNHSILSDSSILKGYKDPNVSLSRYGPQGYKHVISIKNDTLCISKYHIFVRRLTPTIPKKYCNYQIVDIVDCEPGKSTSYLTNMPTGCNIMYRIVPETYKGHIYGNFKTLYARDKYNIAYDTSAIITAESEKEAIRINVNNISPNVTSLRILRKNITIGEKNWSTIKTTKGNNIILYDVGESLDMLDANVREFNTYEYRCELNFNYSYTRYSSNTFVHLHIAPKDLVSINISNQEVIDGSEFGDSTYSIKFTADAETINQTIYDPFFDFLDDNNFRLIEDVLKQLKDQASRIKLFYVERINMSTGEKIYLGLHKDGEFVDPPKTPVGNQSFLDRATRYRYILKPVVKSPTELISESKSYLKNHRSPIVSPEKRAELLRAISNIDTTSSTFSKFFSIFSTSLGTISEGKALIENHGSPYDIGMTGDDIFVDIDTPSIDKLIVISTNSTVLDDNSVILNWRCTGTTSMINYFIVTATKNTGTHPVGPCHNIMSNGIYRFIDTTNRNYNGSITYAVTPVLYGNEDSHGETFTLGTVIINKE